MSSTTNNNHAKTNKNLLSKMFGNKVNPTPDFSTADDSASTKSGATLVQEQPTTKTLSRATAGQEQPLPPMSKDEQASFSDLMAKANTMPPEEFKAYLARHKAEVEAAQDKSQWARSWQYSKDFVNNEAL